ncbi:hypothetical protein BELL_0221g00100 [Botrytis elliptica]|uniref:Uncharacterized protein n=1 Tax=Botrytis elliptica TaxID=278938 RepID=A0A4Z1JPC2_9HELO|nr:hypothetical protein EAE99_011995 [Botrytis elliptica]TGO75316.1 hypothetical protein BELL_0221g00100 [Botrytis elliptica]
MQTQWPVINYIGMVEEINAAYKLSGDTQQAAICYEKCNDLLFQIEERGYLFIAHTHLILAVLASSRDPTSIQQHIQIALLQIRNFLSLPENACRIGVYDPSDCTHALFLNKPYADIRLMTEYHLFVLALQQEHSDMFSKQSWKSWDTIFKAIGKGDDAFRCEDYELEVKSAVTGLYVMEPFHKPILPKIAKTEDEIASEKWERGARWWRYMNRELAKGNSGEDVHLLGGAYLAPFFLTGIFGFWDSIEKIALGGFRGYGGLSGEVGGWRGEGDTGGESARVVDKDRERLERTFNRVRLTGYCRTTLPFTPKIFDYRDCVCVQHKELYSNCSERDKAIAEAELRIQGYASTSGCGYQWDF